MRKNARRDANEGEIVDYLRRQGVLVIRLDMPCDLLCFYKGRLSLLEVKNEDGRNMTAGKELTPSQKQFVDDGWPIRVVWTKDDAHAAFFGG